MTKIEKLLAEMQENPQNVRFSDLIKVCDHYFGESRQRGSHHVYKTPWRGKPLVNIQVGKSSKAKDYQVRQVLEAVEKMKAMDDDKP